VSPFNRDTYVWNNLWINLNLVYFLITTYMCYCIFVIFSSSLNSLHACSFLKELKYLWNISIISKCFNIFAFVLQEFLIFEIFYNLNFFQNKVARFNEYLHVWQPFCFLFTFLLVFTRFQHVVALLHTVERFYFLHLFMISLSLCTL
jgi:hypothetical protein